ncbi:unnamed protein product [Pylaiella littoralis]
MEVPVFPYQETRRGEVVALRGWLARGGQINSPLLRSVAETWTPLTLACAEGDVALVRLLVETGGARASASVGTKVLASSAPLHVASRYGHAGVATVLLELGAVVDARDTIGMMPLHYAAGNGHLKTIEVLLGAGAGTSSSFSSSSSSSSSSLSSSESPGGATALDLAEMAGFHDAAALLRSRALARDGVARRRALGSWLGALGCKEFLGRFLKAGYDDLPFMAAQGLTEADLDCVGVPRDKLGLRKKLLAMHDVDMFLDATSGGSGGSSGTEDASTVETASESGEEGSSSGDEGDSGDDGDVDGGSDEDEDRFGSDGDRGETSSTVDGSDGDGSSGSGGSGSDSESDA